MDRVTLDREWWADKDGNPVPFGSTEGVSVLYGIGAFIPASVAASLNALEQAPEDKMVEAVADKAIRAPRAKK